MKMRVAQLAARWDEHDLHCDPVPPRNPNCTGRFVGTAAFCGAIKLDHEQRYAFFKNY